MLYNQSDGSALVLCMSFLRKCIDVQMLCRGRRVAYFELISDVKVSVVKSCVERRHKS